jgi:hypothetical protein
LDVLNFTSSAGGKIPPRPWFLRNKKVGEFLVDCPYFSASALGFDQRIYMNVAAKPPEQFGLWVFLEGEGRIDWSSTPHGMFKRSCAGEFCYKPGECWFIPADFGSRGYSPKTKTSLLVASPIHRKAELEKKNTNVE